LEVAPHTWGTATGNNISTLTLDSRLTAFKLGDQGGVPGEKAGQTFTSKIYYDEWFQGLSQVTTNTRYLD
jgi:hypothetical protein